MKLQNLEIVLFGNPILRSRCKEVRKDEFNTLPDLVNNMIHTTIKNKGSGLAACQVGVNKRIFVAQIGDDMLPFINPIVKPVSNAKIDSNEGCLSIPGFTADIKRFRSIIVDYLDVDGKSHRKMFSGMPAIIIQHETDHLDGTMFIDKIVNRGEKRKLMRRIKKALNL